MKPTVGRIVYFYDMYMGNVTEHAAVVTFVHNEECVNLSVFTPNGGYLPMFSVSHTPLDLEGATLDEKLVMIRCWGWMPYQKGQAAKTEQLEKKVTDMKVGGSN